jgi:carboxyl-terminal processing protease
LPAFQVFKGPAGFNAGFHDDEKVWNALTAYAAKDSIDLRSIPAKEKTVLQHRVKALLAMQIWRNEGYYEVSNDYDPAFAKALEVVSK